MRTAGPATRPAHTALELREGFFDTNIPCLFLSTGRYPADPLIARQRRDIFPNSQQRRGRNQGFLQIRRHFMYRPADDLLAPHFIDDVKPNNS